MRWMGAYLWDDLKDECYFTSYITLHFKYYVIKWYPKGNCGQKVAFHRIYFLKEVTMKMISFFHERNFWIFLLVETISKTISRN